MKAVPRAQRDEIAGVSGDALKVRLRAPPVEGKANQALIDFVAKVLSVKRSDVEILRGGNARLKTVRVRGISARKLKDILAK